MHLVSKKAGRLDYFDMARGLGMLSIIIGHMGSSVVSDFVFTYHVPLFFLISGFFTSLALFLIIDPFNDKKYEDVDGADLIHK